MKQIIINLALSVIFLIIGFATGFLVNEFTNFGGSSSSSTSTIGSISSTTSLSSTTTSSTITTSSATGDDKPAYIDNPVYQVIKSEMSWDKIEEVNITDPLNASKTFPTFKFSASKADPTNTDTKYNSLMLKLKAANWEEISPTINSTQGIFVTGKSAGYYVNVGKLTGVQVDGSMDTSKAGYYVLFSKTKVY